MNTYPIFQLTFKAICFSRFFNRIGTLTTTWSHLHQTSTTKEFSCGFSHDSRVSRATRVSRVFQFQHKKIRRRVQAGGSYFWHSGFCCLFFKIRTQSEKKIIKTSNAHMRGWLFFLRSEKFVSDFSLLLCWWQGWLNIFFYIFWWKIFLFF